jgi:hypothetical protein
MNEIQAKQMIAKMETNNEKTEAVQEHYNWTLSTEAAHHAGPGVQ